MKLIFLDIDGVLNRVADTCVFKGCLGVDPVKVGRLKTIVEATGAQLILTSTWKVDWDSDLKKCTSFGKYLIDELAKFDLKIEDKTVDPQWSHRGQGICDYLHNTICDGFVILDDEKFDFEEQGLSSYHVKTSFYGDFGGLQDEHVRKAILILNAQ